MANTFPEMIRLLESYGLVDVLLPFLLIFTIAFAVLQKSQILGSNRRPYNKVIAFVLALSAIIPHVLNLYPPGADVIDIINRALPNVSLVMVASMMVLLIAGVFGKNIGFAGTEAEGFIITGAIVIVVYIFMVARGAAHLPAWLSFLNDSETQSLIITLLVFGIIIWFITREPRHPDDDKTTTREALNKIFKGSLGKKD